MHSAFELIVLLVSKTPAFYYRIYIRLWVPSNLAALLPVKTSEVDHPTEFSIPVFVKYLIGKEFK